MIKQFVDPGKSIGGQQVAVSAALAAAAKPYMVFAEKVLAMALRTAKASSPRHTVDAKLKNSFDGEVNLGVTCIVENWPITFKATATIADGKTKFSEKDVADAIEAALKAAKEAPLAVAAEGRKLEVDLQKVVAVRVGDIVTFTNPELPTWSLMVKAAEMMDAESRKFVPSRVEASLRGYCLTEFKMVAAFKQEAFKMPVIQASVVAKVEPAKPAQWQVPVQAAPQQADQSIHNISASGRTTPPISQSVQASNDNRRMFEAHIKSMAEPAAINWVRSSLKGGNPSVIGSDLTSLAYDKQRLLTGAAVINIKFYGSTGVEEANIAVPFDRNGRPDLNAIQRTKADLMAEEEHKAALKIKSDEDAKRAFDDFVASEKAKKIKADGLGIKAGIGYGGSKPLPNFLIPVPKVSIPDEYSVVGKKLVVDGMVYEIEPTNYNAPDVDHSTFWMLRLKPELGIKDADYVPNYSGVTAQLAASGR